MTSKTDMQEVGLEEGNGGPAMEKALDEAATNPGHHHGGKKHTGAVWKTTWFSLVVIFLGLAALGLGLGLGLSNKNDRDKTIDQVSNQSPDDGSNTPETPGDTGTGGTDTGGTDTGGTDTGGTDTGGTDTETGSGNDQLSLAMPARSNLLQGVSLPVMTAATVKETYTSCDALRTDLKAAALYVVDQTINCNEEWHFSKGKWGYGCGGGYYRPLPLDMAFEDAVATGGAPDKAEGAVQGRGSGENIQTSEDSFGTNNQILGVEEADFLQSDGEQTFAVYGREIVEYDVETRTIATRTVLPDPCGESSGSERLSYWRGNVNGMLLIEKRLAVFAYDYTYNCPDGEDAEETIGVSTTSSIAIDGRGGIHPIINTDSTTTVYIYDTTTMGLLSTTKLAGDYISSRAINNDAYLVSRNYINSYDLTQHFDPYMVEIFGPFEDLNSTTYRAKAEAEAEKRVDTFVDQLIGELDCTSVQPIALLQNTEDSLGFSSVMESVVSIHAFSVDTVGTTSPTVNTRNMLLPSTHWDVFASTKYIALSGHGFFAEPVVTPEEDGEGDDEGPSTTVGEETYIIVFELDGPSIGDVFLGTVPGYALDQFSMDHFTQLDTTTNTNKEYFRIATCSNQRWWWGGANWDNLEEGLCEVNVLEIAEDMPIVGTVPDLGKEGERIYAVRFVGDRGFVVTFRETDPFYTLNLADPNDPKKVGELEIPGFSSYLHPIDDDYILGVGQSIVDNRRGGLKISLFDVSDFANPKEVKNFTETNGASSSAEYDHRAFRYLPQTGLLILPLRVWGTREEGGGLDGFSCYHIDVESTTVEPYMMVEHGKGNFYTGCWSPGWLHERSIVVDGLLSTFKSHSIVTSNLSNRTLVKYVNLDENIDKESCVGHYFGE